MKYLFIILTLISFKIFSRDIGQTEITTDEGIEVFQNEKYYLLKKNVIILSDNFDLKAELVKAYFEKDLYDIIKIESFENVELKSQRGLLAKGENINFSTINEDIYVIGKDSSLKFNEINMYSDELINVNNLNGKFNLKGVNSELKTEEIQIFGNVIEGEYLTINEINEVQNLYVEDDNQINIITETMNMFALKAKYSKKENVIELFENVKIIRGNEIIIGDYAFIDTLKDSYKVKSNKKQKVKAVITSTDE